MFNKNSILSVVIVIVLSIGFTGCSNQQANPDVQQQSAENEQENEEIPDILKGIEKSIESIIFKLGGPAVDTEGEMQEQQDSLKSQKGKQDKKQEEEKQGQEQGQEQDQNQEKGNQKQKSSDIWNEISSLIENLHYQWNSYMPMIAKKGANNVLIDNFGNALNNLTNSLSIKNIEESLLSTSKLYSYIPNIYSLYRSKISPEIKRIRYYSRNIILVSKNEDWAQTESDMTNLKSSWNLFKNSLDKNQEDNSVKMDYSLYELEKAIKTKNKLLVEIKGKITLDNIKNIEKSTEQSI